MAGFGEGGFGEGPFGGTPGGLHLEALYGAPCPRVGITLDAMPTATASVVTVWRSSSGGKRRPVRGFQRRTVYGADYVIDYEAPLGREVTYELEVVSGATVPEIVSATVTLDATTGYVQDPLVPATAVAISGRRDGRPFLTSETFAKLEYAMAESLVPILGSDEPVSLAGERLAAAGIPFVLLARAADQSGSLRSIVRTAHPICVRPLPSWPGASALPDVMYLASGSIVEEPAELQNGIRMARFRVTGDVVAPGSMSILVPIWTYAEVEALWSTYGQKQQAATAVGASYLADLRDPTLGGI